MAGGAREYVAAEAAKCSYCGFCEAACPTLRVLKVRSAGPRGRVALAAMAAEGILTPGLLEGLESCLLCGACLSYCPARVDVVELVRAARALIASRLLS